LDRASLDRSPGENSEAPRPSVLGAALGVSLRWSPGANSDAPRDFIRQQHIRPATKLNFSLSVASTVPSSVRLSRFSGDLSEIFPNYRDFNFFVARQELVIVDPQSYAIVAFVPFSGGNTIGAAPPGENTGTAGTAPPRETTVGITETPVPAKKKATPAEKKRVTVTEETPGVIEPDTTRRRPAHTETDVTVRASRRDSDDFDAAPRRDIAPPVRQRLGPPVRERVERDQGLPFPFSLLFFGWPK